MLLLQQRMRPLQRLQPLQLPGRGHPHRRGHRNATPQHPLPGFLTPLRQHEGMDLQGIGYVLPQDPVQLTQLHALSLNSRLYRIASSELPLNVVTSSGDGGGRCETT